MEMPRYLKPDQNFFTQPPFEEAATTASQASGIEQYVLHKVLYAGTKHRDMREAHFGDPSATDFLNHALTHPHPRYPGMGIVLFSLSCVKQIDPERLKTAFRTLGKTLSPHPFWAEYVGNILDQGLYNSDGTLRAKTTSAPLFDLTYLAWVKQQLEGLSGHKEVLQAAFPQDLGVGTPEERLQAALQQYGCAHPAEPWRSRVAVETVREKRS